MSPAAPGAPEHRHRDIDPTQPISLPLVGYTDRLGAAPGETITFHVSSDHARYRSRLVRLIHGDTNPDGPGFKQIEIPSAIDGERAGEHHAIRSGSYAVLPAGTCPDGFARASRSLPLCSRRCPAWAAR